MAMIAPNRKEAQSLLENAFNVLVKNPIIMHPDAWRDLVKMQERMTRDQFTDKVKLAIEQGSAKLDELLAKANSKGREDLVLAIELSGHPSTPDLFKGLPIEEWVTLCKPKNADAVESVSLWNPSVVTHSSSLIPEGKILAMTTKEVNGEYWFGNPQTLRKVAEDISYHIPEMTEREANSKHGFSGAEYLNMTNLRSKSILSEDEQTFVRNLRGEFALDEDGDRVLLSDQISECLKPESKPDYSSLPCPPFWKDTFRDEAKGCSHVN